MISTSALIETHDLPSHGVMPLGSLASEQNIATPTQSSLTFQDLLMTFSFDFRTAAQFNGFAVALLEAIEDASQQLFESNSLYIDQLSISPLNEIRISDRQCDFECLRAPEYYVKQSRQLTSNQLRDKSLAYCIGMILLEVLAQRPVQRAPDGITTRQYSRFMHKQGRLGAFADVVARSSFASETKATQEQMIDAQHVSFVLRGLLETDCSRRLSITQAIALFKSRATLYDIQQLRALNQDAHGIVTKVSKESPENAVDILKGLLGSITKEGDRAHRPEEALSLKRALSGNHLDPMTCADKLEDLLLRQWSGAKEQKHFSYLQMFYLKYQQQTDRMFVADQLASFCDLEFVDPDEYLSAQNVVQYFGRTKLYRCE